MQFAGLFCRMGEGRSCREKAVFNVTASFMDALTTFGLVAVSLMLAFYALEDRSAWFILAFSGSCLLAAVYGFLQGAWPFGAVETVWSGVALRRWQRHRARELRTSRSPP